LTGLRCGEVLGLHLEDLDLSSCRIHVRRSVWRGQEVSVKTKSGNRTVNMEPALAEMLRQHLAGRKSGRVFQTQNGTPFSKDNVRRKLVSVLDRLGLKRGGLHAFRHGRVSVLQENGVPGDLVKEWISSTSFLLSSQEPTIVVFTIASPADITSIAVRGHNREGENKHETPDLFGCPGIGFSRG
jgi:integrase